MEEGFNQDLCRHAEQILVWVFSNVGVYFLEDTNVSTSLPPKSFLIHISSVAGLKSSHSRPLLPVLEAAGQCREGAPRPLMTNDSEKERWFLELHPRESNPARVPGRASTAMEISAFKEQKKRLEKGVGTSRRSRGATNPMDCFTNSRFSPMKLYTLQKNHLAPTSFGKWSINRTEKSSYLSRNRARMGCDRQERGGTAARPLGFCSFLRMAAAGSLNPTKQTRLFQHNGRALAEPARCPLLAARGRRARGGGRRAERFLQKGLDLIKVIFFSNI